MFVPRSIAPNLASLAPEATLLESLYTLPVWFSYGVCGDFNMMVMILKLMYRFQLISISLSTADLSQLAFYTIFCLGVYPEQGSSTHWHLPIQAHIVNMMMLNPWLWAQWMCQLLLIVLRTTLLVIFDQNHNQYYPGMVYNEVMVTLPPTGFQHHSSFFPRYGTPITIIKISIVLVNNH